jgi:hypothetical protein
MADCMRSPFPAYPQPLIGHPAEGPISIDFVTNGPAIRASSAICQ